MNLWRGIRPFVAEAVMGVAALALVAVYGIPSLPVAQARPGSAASSPASRPATPPPFRMLPSDLNPGGASAHPITKGPFLGVRK